MATVAIEWMPYRIDSFDRPGFPPHAVIARRSRSNPEREDAKRAVWLMKGAGRASLGQCGALDCFGFASQ